MDRLPRNTGSGTGSGDRDTIDQPNTFVVDDVDGLIIDIDEYRRKNQDRIRLEQINKIQLSIQEAWTWLNNTFETAKHLNQEDLYLCAIRMCVDRLLKKGYTLQQIEQMLRRRYKR